MYYSRAQQPVRRLAAELYLEQQGYLMAIARRHALNEADAEEALQEAFAAFIEHFDPGCGAPPLAWLTLTLKRACWRARRERVGRLVSLEAEVSTDESRSVAETVTSSAPSLDERVADREDGMRRLRSLKADQRTALVLQAAGYSYREIGERRNWTYTKVNRCVTEGRRALR
jgi:RNA polymerase sigma factor (sigma-70 family)